jgi:hypothetical protein
MSDFNALVVDLQDLLGIGGPGFPSVAACGAMGSRE